MSDPDNYDANEAYDVIPATFREGSWTVTGNGIPVWHAHDRAVARDAGHYIQELPKATQERPEWQTAAQALLLVVECSGDTLLAYIGLMRALRVDKPGPEPTRRRKRAKKIQNNPMNRIARVT
jgi:hypothetical protein